MYKLFTKKIQVNLLSTALVCLLPLTAIAAKSDKNVDISISAKRQESDLKNKIASYIGNVEISQGSLSIKAELVQVFTHQTSNDKTYLAQGEPAKFHQKLEDGTLVILEAKIIKYEPNLNLLTIEGDARLSQEGSEVRGSKITYNTLTEQLEAESEENNAVTTILKPQVKKEVKQ